LCDAVANVSGGMALIVPNNVTVDPGAVPFAAPRVITSSASAAIDVRSADLDGDGDTDVVGSSYADDTLRWYENSGTYPPTFVVRVVATGLDFLCHVDTGDVDGDDDVDIVVSSRGDSRVTLHVNDGRRPPSFTLMNISTAATTSVFSCFGDVDGDGDLDVVTTLVDRVVWFENVSNRSRVAFGAARVIVSGSSDQSPWGAFVADVDRDGDVDVFQNMHLGGRVVLYASDGASVPMFSAGVNVATTTGAYGPLFRPMVADVNSDGAADVVVVSSSDSTFAAHLTSPSASSLSFTRIVMSTAYSGPNDVEAVDLDGDGDVDIVGAASVFDGVVWFENSGTWPTPSFTARVIASGAANSLDGCRRSHPVDIDNDGDIDVITASDASSSVTWIENTSPVNRSRFRVALPPTLNRPPCCRVDTWIRRSAT
jgi:hypothetical protein